MKKKKGEFEKFRRSFIGEKIKENKFFPNKKISQTRENLEDNLLKI